MDLAIEVSGNHKNKKVLDVGCGDGFFVNYLSKKGFKNVEGLDYSKQAIKLAKERQINKYFFVYDLTQNKLPENKYDIITLIEVLEHIQPYKINIFLKNILGGIKVGGKLIVTVPSTNTKLINKHFQHFSDKTLRHIFKRSNLKIIKIIGQNDLVWYKNILYKILHNRLYNIIKLSNWYNQNIYPKWVNRSKIKSAGRLILFAEKK